MLVYTERVAEARKELGDKIRHQPDNPFEIQKNYAALRAILQTLVKKGKPIEMPSLFRKPLIWGYIQELELWGPDKPTICISVSAMFGRGASNQRETQLGLESATYEIDVRESYENAHQKIRIAPSSQTSLNDSQVAVGKMSDIQPILEGKIPEGYKLTKK